MKLNYFQPIQAVTTVDITVDERFTPIDKDLYILTENIVNIGETQYKEVVLLAGSRVFVYMTPNQELFLTDREKALNLKILVDKSKVIIAENIDFP